MAKKDFDDQNSIGSDIAKDIFYIIAFDADGRLVLHKQIESLAPMATFEKLPRCVVSMVPKLTFCCNRISVAFRPAFRGTCRPK